MMPLSPRDAQMRLPRTSPPTSARRSYELQQRQLQQRQDSHRQLQLLDLAFQGHAPAHTSAAAFTYELHDDAYRSRPSSARSTRSTRSSHSVRSSRGREYADDALDRESSYRQQQYHLQQHQHQQQQQQQQQQLYDEYSNATAAYDELATSTHEYSAAAVPQDESVLMEASDPELFQAGVEEHARRLGMDPLADADFLWLARESLVAPLPAGWYHVTATATGAPYYYNEHSGESRWDHPCDDQFRAIFCELQLQQQQQRHASHRYDHYSPATVATTDIGASGGSAIGDSDAHTASYYAAVGNYQTLAWEAEAHDADATAAHSATASSSHDWSAHADTNEQLLASSDAYTPADDTYSDMTSEYDTESIPVLAPQTSSARVRSSTALQPRVESTATAADGGDDSLQQHVRALEALRLQDAKQLSDLREQVTALTSQLATQVDTHRELADAKRHVDAELIDVAAQLDALNTRSDALTESNATLSRELLAAHSRFEEQQQQQHVSSSDVDADAISAEVARLTALVASAQTAREETERKHVATSEQLEAAQLEAAALRMQLAALSDQHDADASACAAMDTLTQQLRTKDVALSDAQALTQQLERRIAEQTAAAAAQQTAMSQTLAAKTSELESAQRETAVLRQELQDARAATQRAEHLAAEQQQLCVTQRNEADEQRAVLKREARALERDLKALQSASTARDDELCAAAQQIAALEAKLSAYESDVESARRAGFAEAERASAEVIRQTQAEKTRVAELYAQELQARRKLHNRLMELQGNIRVFCRVRPIQPVELKSEQAAPAIFFRDDDHESLELIVGGGDTAADAGKSSSSNAPLLGQRHAFEFDHVFPPASTQTQVFEQTRALVVSALDGFNVCIFAYGQTGSGKTHTMEGSESDRGVNFRALQELFRIRDDRIAAAAAGGTGGFDCVLKLSILEVYNETIVDLLDSSSSSSSSSSTAASPVSHAKGLDVRMGKTGVYVDNLIEVEVFSERDVADLMKLGHSHRSVGAHDFNEHSSRSHLVLSLQIEMLQRSGADSRRRTSKLHLIDLAGSERVSKTAASGQRLKEAQNINRSLSALGDVIAALGAGSKHVPYRNSKLTFLLSDSLSGSSKVLMFVNVSPVQWNAWETLCSLNFAARCRSVALGAAKPSGSNSSISTSNSSSVGGHTMASTPLATSATTASSSGAAGATRGPPRGAPPSAPKPNSSSQRVAYG